MPPGAAARDVQPGQPYVCVQQESVEQIVAQIQQRGNFLVDVQGQTSVEQTLASSATEG